MKSTIAACRSPCNQRHLCRCWQAERAVESPLHRWCRQARTGKHLKSWTKVKGPAVEISTQKLATVLDYSVSWPHVVANQEGEFGPENRISSNKNQNDAKCKPNRSQVFMSAKYPDAELLTQEKVSARLWTWVEASDPRAPRTMLQAWFEIKMWNLVVIL